MDTVNRSTVSCYFKVVNWINDDFTDGIRSPGMSFLLRLVTELRR